MYVLTANLKKSVTIAVEPLSVMACRMGACLVAILKIYSSESNFVGQRRIENTGRAHQAVTSFASR